MLTRRNLLRLGVVAGGAALIPAAASIRSLGVRAEETGHVLGHGATAGHAMGHGSGTAVAARLNAPAVAPFSVPLPLPATLAPTSVLPDADVYALTTQQATAALLPGLPAPVLTYGGTFVGPTIRAKVGRKVIITHTNALTEETAVHLHGAHVAAAHDGFPTDVIPPGQSRTYEYPNQQLSATLWYHDHAHHREAEHVYRGLHGFYLLEDPAERRLRLPRGGYDIPIMLTDARFAEDGSLVFVPDDSGNRTTLLANGRPAPYLEVARRKYRLRLLNASNMRVYQLELGQNQQMVQIAGDGGLLPAPVPTTGIPLTPGERAEIVVDFSSYPQGTQLVLNDTLSGLPVLRFDVGQTAPDHSAVPSVLRPETTLPAATNVRDVEFAYDFALGWFTINGKLFDPNRVDATIQHGTTEIWRITNSTVPIGVPHNLHVHLVQFRVLDRDGVAVGPAERGLKDTVSVAPGETVRVQATFTGHLGKYVFHCHALDHSSMGMMAVFEVVP
ncbi:multicopper oxidase family protein [Streptosporangium sp. NPDC051022]|uniref:multicopper oxidase family protein n=1 Tax=Streptosporangium sp. NPDC051022 TaxID=3155752 RepID=UPI003444BA0E